MESKVRRSFKDSLFRMIFREKRELLSLYNAINGSDYQDTDELEINTIEDVLYLGMKNDVSFLLDESLNLYEAQSTWNPNMPLRGVFYFSRLYQGYVEQKHLDLYSAKKLQIPMPKYVVFYNGAREIGDSCVIRLSDLFIKKDQEEPSLECAATFLNINYGRNQQIMKNCRKLYEYSYFIAQIRVSLSQGRKLESAVDHAAAECIGAGILEDFLTRHRAEVKDVILTEYNEELHMKTIEEQGFQRGLEEGIERGIGKGLETGIRIFIFDNLEEHIPEERIAAKLQKRFSLSEEKAWEYMKKYSRESGK